MKKTQAKKIYAAGIDLGGTNVVMVLTDTKGNIISQGRFPTEASQGPDYVIKNMAANMNAMIKEAGLKNMQVKTLGIGAPGPLDSKKGIVMMAPNMPGWKNIKLKALMEKYTGIKTAVENDANCAVYGEKWLGAGRGMDNVVGFTLGTGVGGGIILNNTLIRGVSGTAGELGHIIVEVKGRKCGCGNEGCLETYASATGIANTAKDMLKKGSRSVLSDMVRGDISKITSKHVYEAMVKKDNTASAAWDAFVGHLATGVAGMINALNPQVIVIAGGVINAGDRLFSPLRRETAARCFAAPFKAVKIVPAELGEEAGAIGAAGVALNEAEYYGL